MVIMAVHGGDGCVCVIVVVELCKCAWWLCI